MYHRNDPANHEATYCRDCGGWEFTTDDGECEGCLASGDEDEDEDEEPSTPESQRDAGRAVFAAGGSIDDCRGHWQMIGWEQAATDAGHPDYVAV